MLPRSAAAARRHLTFLLSILLVALILTSLISHHVWVPSAAYADTTTWTRTYGDTDDERPSSIHQTSDGGYIVAGFTESFGPSSENFWILKLDSDGNVQWEKTYGGSGSDFAFSVQQTTDGGYVAAGSSESFAAGGNREAWILKLDSDGNVQWEKTYGGSGSDTALSIEHTSDSGYVVIGETYSFGLGSNSAWILKLDSDGNVEWEKTYGGSSSDFLLSVQQTTDGGYIGAGFTNSFGTGAWILKLDSNGDRVWEKTYGGGQASSIQQTADGGYVVASRVLFAPSNFDISILRLDSDGNVEWQKAYGGPLPDFVSHAEQTSEGGYIVAGYSILLDGGIDFWIFKLDSDGNVEWQKRFGGSGQDGLEDFGDLIHQTSDAGYIAAGHTYSFGAGDSDFWILKLDSDGRIANCENTALTKDTNATIQELIGSANNITSSSGNTSATIENTDGLIAETSASTSNPCEPLTPVFNYELDLFENVNDPSDGVANLNQELRAVAETDDGSVDQITLRWISPSAEIAREVTVPISSPEDTFAPDEPGHWIIEADFGNGQVVQKTLSISFFVLPESPIGAVAMTLASIGVLGGFLYFRARKPSI